MSEFTFEVPATSPRLPLAITVPEAVVIFRGLSQLSLSESLALVKANFQNGPVDTHKFGRFLHEYCVRTWTRG